jgi:hypothetical protein
MSIRTLSICLTGAMIVLAAAGAWGDGSAPPIRPMGEVLAELGATRLVGYYVRDAGACDVTMMLDRAHEAGPEARIRFSLMPRARASIEGTEGRILRMTCLDGAGGMTVENGFSGQRIASR